MELVCDECKQSIISIPLKCMICGKEVWCSRECKKKGLRFHRGVCYIEQPSHQIVQRQPDVQRQSETNIRLGLLRSATDISSSIPPSNENRSLGPRPRIRSIYDIPDTNFHPIYSILEFVVLQYLCDYTLINKIRTIGLYTWNSYSSWDVYHIIYTSYLNRNHTVNIRQLHLVKAFNQTQHKLPNAKICCSGYGIWYSKDDI